MAVIEEKKEIETTKKVVAKKAKKASSKKDIEACKNAGIAFRVLVEPWITEKTHAAMSLNKYTFRVTRNATKKEVKKSIEGMYKVAVEKISVVNIHAKKKAYGRHEGKKQAYKKATVTLKQGDKIELFQGA